MNIVTDNRETLINALVEIKRLEAEVQLEREAHRKTWRQLEQAQREKSTLVELLLETAAYLDDNKLNRIESGSILHRKLSAALSHQPEQSNES